MRGSDRGGHFIVVQLVMVDCIVSRILVLLLYVRICFCFSLRPLHRIVSTTRKVAPTNSVPAVPDRVLIRDGTYIRPSDYVSHTSYGVGQYIRSHGILISHIEAAEKKYAPGMVVRFLDGEVLWFQRIAAEELFLFKMGEAGKQTLYSLLNFSKWNVRLKKAQRDSEEYVPFICHFNIIHSFSIISLLPIQTELPRTCSKHSV